MIKEINIEGLPYNRAEIKALLLDGSCKVELFNVDEQGQEVGERDLLASFSEPLPFELTEEEINSLNPNKMRNLTHPEDLPEEGGTPPTTPLPPKPIKREG